MVYLQMHKHGANNQPGIINDEKPHTTQQNFFL